MKFSLFYISFILLINCSNPKTRISEVLKNEEIISVSEKEVPNYQKNYKTLNIYGKVKEINCSDYIQFVPNSEFGNSNIIKMNYKFDTKGNVIEETCILKDNEFNYKNVYSYDNMNNSLKVQSFNEFNKLTFTKKDSLNKQGIFISEDYYEIGKSKKYYRNYEKITNNERIYITYTIVDKKKIDSSKTIEKFKDENLIEKYHYSDNKLLWKNLYNYDKNNNLIFQSEIGSDTMIWNMEYDKNNRMIRWSIKRNDKIINDIFKTYDNFGNLIKEIHYESGKLNNKNSYYYFLKYDKFNNWIVRKRFDLNGKKISELTRKITYF